MRARCVGEGTSERAGRTGNEGLSGPATAAALSAVPGNDPVSATEVAEAVGVPVGTAREALRALAKIDDPDASEMMQSWRRNADRAAFEHLQASGPVEASGIVEAVYPTHAAGVDSGAAWWEMVAPRLGRLPGVVAGEDGDCWRFSTDA